MKLFNQLSWMPDDEKKEAAFKILQTLSGFSYRDVKFILDTVLSSIDFYSTLDFDPKKVDCKSVQSSACTTAQAHQS